MKTKSDNDDDDDDDDYGDDDLPKILVPFQLSVRKVKDAYEKQARCSR